MSEPRSSQPRRHPGPVSEPGLPGKAPGMLLPALLLLVALLFPTLLTPLRANPHEVSEYQVKAAFLYNFVKFVEWPIVMSESSQDPIVVGILGPDPFGPVLDRTFADKRVGGRRFELRRYRTVEELQVCHVLFISSALKRDWSKVLSVVRDAPVMTVSDGDGFVKSGGIIELLLEDNKIRFDINLNEAKKSRLKISAQLLQLAGKVEGK
jgi:hypothetical protein